jgi:putative membrane protein
MKLKIILFNLVITTILFGCDSRNTTDTGTSVENDEFSGNTEDREQLYNKENDFVKTATEKNLKEIRAGEIAQNKAQSGEVKEFAQTLVTDHKDANQQLQRIAQQLGQQNPESQQRNQPNQQNQREVQGQQQTMSTDLNNDREIKKLEDANSKDFDKEFLDLMVKDHEDAIDDFEDAQKDVQDQQLRSWIDKTLPVLRKHLETAKRLQGQQKTS